MLKTEYVILGFPNNCKLLVPDFGSLPHYIGIKIVYTCTCIVWVCLCPFPLFGIFSFKVKCTSSFSTSTKFFGKMPLVTWSSLQSHQPMIQLKALSNPNRFLHQLTSSHYFKLLKQRFQFSIINGSLWIDAYFFYSEGGVKYWIN